MIDRRLSAKIQETLKRSPAIALIGPRQVGKTTLAMEISKVTPSVYLDLEDPLDREKVRDIAAFHAANRTKLIILDEPKSGSWNVCEVSHTLCGGGHEDFSRSQRRSPSG